MLMNIKEKDVKRKGDEIPNSEVMNGCVEAKTAYRLDGSSIHRLIARTGAAIRRLPQAMARTSVYARQKRLYSRAP